MDGVRANPSGLVEPGVDGSPASTLPCHHGNGGVEKTGTHGRTSPIFRWLKEYVSLARLLSLRLLLGAELSSNADALPNPRGSVQVSDVLMILGHRRIV